MQLGIFVDLYSLYHLDAVDSERLYWLFIENCICNLTLQERLAALEECKDLGQGFQIAERDMAIRGFGNIFGEQQTGDVGNVGIDLFFEMLFESLSKVVHRSLFY